jgi:hypothetical protein
MILDCGLALLLASHHITRYPRNKSRLMPHTYMNPVGSACPCLLPASLTRTVPPVPPRQDSTMADERALSMMYAMEFTHLSPLKCNTCLCTYT